MLTKLVFKIVLKAMVPIVCIVGVMSYGMYMRGGDPAGMFKKVLGNSIQSAKSSVQGAGDSLQNVTSVSLPSSKTTVYQWVDERGVTQFGARAPQGIASTAKTFNNNANVMQAPPKPKVAQQAQLPAQTIPGHEGEALPGVAGMNLPTSVDPSVLNEFLQTMQQQQ